MTNNSNLNNNFQKSKDSIIRYYQNIASSQGVRLIGFSAGLFTLLNITRLKPEEHLRKFFSSFTLLNFGIPEVIFQTLSLLFLFACTWILTFFIIRAIFRYVVFSLLGTIILTLSINDIKKIDDDGKSIHQKLNDALNARVTSHEKNKKPLKIFFIFPLHIFYTYYGNKETWKGIVWQLIFSLLATIFLLLIIW